MVMYFKVRQSYGKKSESASKVRQIIKRSGFFDFFQAKTCFITYFLGLYLHFANKIHDFFCLQRVKPLDLLIAPEPCHLFLAIDMSVVTDAFLCLSKGIYAIEIHEHLLHPNSIERIQMPHRQHSSCLGFQSVVEHLLHSLVDALIQFLPVALQADLHDMERAFFPFACVERTERPTC